MLLQSASLLFFPLMNPFYAFVIAAAFPGLGTAMAYPTFLASVADLVYFQERAESVGVFRLWCDLGYTFGALLAGIIADYLNLSAAILFVGILTLLSTFYVLVGMNKLGHPIKEFQQIETKM